MRALVRETYGDPSVLRVADVAERALGAGESLIVDLFPRGRMFADCTRTFCVGRPSEALASAHAAVREALAAAPAVPPATVVFAIQPWGEVFVNGKSGGVSPPMKSMKLAPGKYKIEIRNTTFAAHTETVEVKSRDELTIRHRFQ